MTCPPFNKDFKSIIPKIERKNMSQQHKKWIDIVKKRLHDRGWSQSDFAIVLGVSPAMVTRLLKEGHGSDDLKLKVNKKLRISESWESFEEYE